MVRCIGDGEVYYGNGLGEDVKEEKKVWEGGNRWLQLWVMVMVRWDGVMVGMVMVRGDGDGEVGW